MAAFDPFYTTGTVSVANGGTTVTGVGTGFNTAGIRAGDLFINSTFTSWTVVTADPTSATSLAITAWPGTALAAGSSYRIWRISDADRVIAASAAFMQSLVPNLTAFGGLTLAANKSIYATGAGALATYDLSPFARTLLDDADAAAARTTLGAVSSAGGALAGLNFRAFSAADTDITGVIAGATPAGGLIEGSVNGHVAIGIRGNDATDAFTVIQTSLGNQVTYTTNVLAANASKFKYLGNDVFHGGLSQIKPPNIISGRVNIADDAVADIGNICPTNVGCLLLWQDNNVTPNVCGGYSVRTSASVILSNQFGPATNVELVSTDVTGTTGIDGHVTLSVTPGHFKIENRSSVLRSFGYLVMGGL